MKKIFVGFAILAVALAAGPALAWGNHGGGSDITVTNDKTAKVTNNVVVVASTGNNVSAGDSGGDGGDGGVGGKVNIDNDGNDGGNGGNGGNGGTINTGNAYAKSEIKNIVNTDITKISCDCEDTDDITVDNTDNARVKNNVGVGASTGDNASLGWDGGSGGNGGVGGKINIDNDDNDGGNGGVGGDGGSVDTGNAYAKSKVVNIVNTIITRIE